MKSRRMKKRRVAWRAQSGQGKSNPETEQKRGFRAPVKVSREESSSVYSQSGFAGLIFFVTLYGKLKKIMYNIKCLYVYTNRGPLRRTRG